MYRFTVVLLEKVELKVFFVECLVLSEIWKGWFWIVVLYVLL